MFAKTVALGIILMSATSSASTVEPVTMNRWDNIKTECGDRNDWSDPAPPVPVFANVYMVGTCGITALLITTPKGHILIDGATNEAAEGIADNIRKLGVDPRDIRFILVTHEHLDHAGGIAKLKQITGAKLAIREPARVAMETGLPTGDDPQHGIHPAFPGVKADLIIQDGKKLRVGNQTITIIATPGHSPGGTSYTWKACEGTICRQIVYADSLNAVSADSYHFSDHPAYVATLRSSMAKIESIKNCDIMISPHPAQSNFFARLAGEAPLVDPDVCKSYVAAARKRLDDRLAEEAESPKANN